MTPKRMTEMREAACLEYIERQREMGAVNTRHMDDLDGAFESGWDKALELSAQAAGGFNEDEAFAEYDKIFKADPHNAEAMIQRREWVYGRSFQFDLDKERIAAAKASYQSIYNQRANIIKDRDEVFDENIRLRDRVTELEDLLRKARRNWCSTTTNWQLLADEYFLKKGYDERQALAPKDTK